MNVQEIFQSSPELQQEFPDWRRFVLAWEKYQYKKSLWPSVKAWHKLSEAEKTRAEMQIEAYVKSTPDTKYRCHMATWLNQKRFYDEVSTDPFLKIANEILHKNQNH